MQNEAISWRTDEYFTAGKKYLCGTLDGNMIEVFDNDNKPVWVGIDDKDFTFILNPVPIDNLTDEQKKSLSCLLTKIKEEKS